MDPALYPPVPTAEIPPPLLDEATGSRAMKGALPRTLWERLERERAARTLGWISWTFLGLSVFLGAVCLCGPVDPGTLRVYRDPPPPLVLGGTG